jgi:hypothetical protein
MTAWPGELPSLLALGVSSAAIVAGVLALVATRRPLLALKVLLDLLLAAGLLRLTGDPGWRTILTAAAIVAVRRLIGVGLRAGGRAWSSGQGSGPGVRPPAPTRLVRPAWRS